MMNRIVYLDYLRAFAAFAVVLLHVSAVGFRTTFSSPEWHAYNFYDSISRWGVPIFVMISGALFLNTAKNLDFNRLWCKNIFRIVKSFIFWSTFYALFVSLFIKHNTEILYIIGRIISGDSHLWYLYMILGLYVCVPILKSFAANQLLVKYFLFLSLLTTFAIPQVLEIVHHFLPKYQIALGVLDSTYETIGVTIALGYSGYFVLGHYMNELICLNSKKISIYRRGGVGLTIMVLIVTFIIIFVSTEVVSETSGRANKYFYGNLRPLVLIASVCVFLLTKGLCQKLEKPNKIISHIASVSFGIYLIHPVFIYIIKSSGIYCYHYPWLLVPLYTIFIFLTSYLIATILYKIPVINKHIL